MKKKKINDAYKIYFTFHTVSDELKIIPRNRPTFADAKNYKIYTKNSRKK